MIDNLNLQKNINKIIALQGLIISIKPYQYDITIVNVNCNVGDNNISSSNKININLFSNKISRYTNTVRFLL